MVIPPPPGSDDPVWLDGQREDAFWRVHYDEYTEKYPDQFVAVLDEEVVAVADHLLDLIDELEHQGLKPTQVWAHYFMTARPLAL